MPNFSNAALLIILALSLGAVTFLKLASSPRNSREPPTISASLPYIGHVVGLMRSKFNYYVQLSQQSSLPIFTLNLPGAKMYIVTSLELVQAIQKKSKVLAFAPIEAKFASKVCGTSADAHQILMNNVNGDEGDWGLSVESYAAMRSALLSSPDLDKMNRVMIQSIAASLDSLEGPADKVTLKLAQWLRSNVTLATTNSIYGPQNPFKDDAVADAFWQFESQLMTILVGVLPSITARKGIAGRDKVAKAFENYFRIDGHKNASILMRNRYETSAKNEISEEDIARFEVGGSIAILVNTVPAAFWMLLLVYSYPGLLNDIRKELDSVVSKTVDNNLVRYLDITLLKTKCLLLTSTFQEVLRYRSMGTSIRHVMQDTVLNDQWLLKKDCMVQMPSRIIHTDSKIWGTDVDEFNPRRFLKDQGQNMKRPNPAAFRAFGGGTTLCPGRHFATNEVLAVVSMFVMRYDMTPTDGEWSLPKTDNTNVASVIMEPDTDVEVEISARKGFEEGRWIYDLKDSEAIVAMVAEDSAENPAGEKTA
ncbi:hypothetical protein MMC07_009180 [Pseudocyphellaria aurata]|nr:hypothetical protein [Pseudocyphellaria aurata]